MKISSFAKSNHTLDDCRRYQPVLNPLLADVLLTGTQMILSGLQIPFFLAFGTCLGAVRDQRFIPHDDDVDIGLLATDRRRVVLAINGGWFSEKEMLVIRETDHLISVEFHGQYLDMYFFERGPECYNCSFYQIAHEHLDDGLDSWPFMGMDLHVPKNVEKYLESRYGPNWRTPEFGKHAST